MRASARGTAPDSEGQPRSVAALLALGLSLALACATFIALGAWQVRRLHWKLDLIARVEERVHAPAVPAPGPDAWQRVDAAGFEYRHVLLSGIFLHERCTLVQASTELGPGFWVLTPLRAADGSLVLVNRGFIASAEPGSHDRYVCPRGTSTAHITGLLRLSEPGGSFLRRNDPATHRWYSRDVQAIAAAQGLGPVAPYFVDADASAAPGQAGSSREPVGGLTVIAFHNNHLLYAIIWFSLAAMSAAALGWVLRDELRLRRPR